MRFQRVLFLALAASIGSACDERLRDVAGPTPDLQPTLSSIQREIFNKQDSSGRLACTQCHTNAGRTPTGGLLLIEGQSYSSLVGRASIGKPDAVRVIPGDPEASYLIHKLEGRSTIVGVRMPRSAGPYLTTGQISIIRRWIQLGAKND
ncbi:MAG: hypothetical protein Q7R30_01320 [Acidobacteriota bacterium]|nr:hypothetical protein [Acidobacteriota bacterium]